jgi:hypothetical protein
VTHLIRGAIFRPTYPWLSTRSEGICPFGELVDMFHNHEATKSHDKVYALLGMSSNDMSRSSLLPNYSILFEELFQQLVKFILSDKVDIKTCDNKEAAVIAAKSYVLGSIISVEDFTSSENGQRVKVFWGDILQSSKYSRHYLSSWVPQVSETPLQAGDLVSLLQGATKPTIIRV